MRKEELVVTLQCDLCQKLVTRFTSGPDQYYPCVFGLHKSVYYGYTNKMLDLCSCCSDKLQGILKKEFNL